MAAHRRLIIAPAALHDLEGIRQHIAADNPTAARDQVERILKHADMLRDFPEMGIGRSRPAPSLRSVVEHPYVISYFPRENRIEIVRVFHGHQDVEEEISSFFRHDLDTDPDPTA